MAHPKFLSLLPIMFCLAFVNFSVFADTEATAKKTLDIKADKKRKADNIQKVKKGERLLLGNRDGLWYPVIEPVEGWVKITQVKVDESGASGSSSLAGLSSGRAGAGNTVASSGARGLDAADIETGSPDFKAVAEMDDFASLKPKRKFFAKLETRKIQQKGEK